MTDAEIHEKPELDASDEEVKKELDKEPGETLEATPAGSVAAMERLNTTIDQAAGIGTDGDAFGMETNLIEKVVGHDG